MNRIVKNKGFTLIEMMIVIIIIGVLSAIAYPLYTNYIRDGRIEEGKALLMNDAQYMQRWYLDRGTYAGTAAAAFPSNNLNPLNQYYTFAFVGIPSATQFVIRASPTAKMTPYTTDYLTVDQDSILQSCVSATNCRKL